MIDDVGQNEFDQKETSFVWHSRAAVSENSDCGVILIAVKHVLHDVNISSGRNRVAKIGDQKLTPSGKTIRSETRRCLSYGFRAIDQHAAQVRKSRQDSGHQPAAAPT